MEERSRRIRSLVSGALFALAFAWGLSGCTTREEPAPPKLGAAREDAKTRVNAPAREAIAPAPEPEKKATAPAAAPAEEAAPAAPVAEEPPEGTESPSEPEAEPKPAEAASAAAETVEKAEPEEKEESLAPFVPTPMEVVEEMLKTAGVTEKDVVYDLGCGDGRIVAMAAQKFGAKAVGVDLDPDRIKESTERIRENKLEERVTIIQGDLLKVDLSPATVVTLYLMPDANRKLRPIMEKALKPGSRVVSHDFSVAGWDPDETKTIRDSKGWEHTIYLYRLPKP